MMQLRVDTFLHIEGVVMPTRAAVDYAERWTSVSEPEDYQTWDGQTHIVAPTYKTKYRIVLNGTSAFRMPGMDDVQPGAEVIFHSRVPRTAVIPAGSSQCILSRDPVPGSILVVDPTTHEPVPHTQAGRIISIAAPATKALAVIHSWRMVCFLRKPIEMTIDGRTGDLDWSFEVIEKVAPQ